MVWDLANDRRLFQVLRRYLVKLEKSKMLALREYDSDAPGRPGYFLDAKLVWQLRCSSAGISSVAEEVLIFFPLPHSSIRTCRANHKP
jgi:hypothetical protein